MKKKSLSKPLVKSDFESLIASIVRIHHESRDFAAKAVNVGLTLRNWFIGQRIVEFAPLRKRETLSPELLARAGASALTLLLEFALGDLSNQLFVSRYAVEMPKKQATEAFLNQLGKEVRA